jgi:uncharacterized protein
MDRMLILIDGYNVIRRTPSLAVAEQHGLYAARDALKALVVARYRGTPHRVLLVFDGVGPTETAVALRCGVGSQEIYAATDTTADGVIRRVVDASRADWGNRIAVFSDDWEVTRHATQQGAHGGSAAELAQHLTQAPRHLRHRAQHHEYVQRSAYEGMTDTPRQPRTGNAHKAPRRRRR